MEKKLTRSRTNRMIWGVCGGLAEYFKIDPVIIRIIAVLLILADGIGLLAYIIMAIVVPLEGSKAATPSESMKENVEEIKDTANSLGEDIRSTFSHKETGEHKPGSPNRALTIAGIVIVVIGVLFLLTSFDIFSWFSWRYIWPLILVAIGLIIVFTARRK
jgi:phage shock protein C